MRMKSLLEQSLDLPIRERIRLVDDILDSLTLGPEATERLVAQISEIRLRIQRYQRDPSKLLLWEDVRVRLRQIT